MNTLKLTDRQLLLLDFVKQQHGEQKRKYTNEPYWHHLVNVATIVAEYEPDGVEVALCHDLFEDTQCDWHKLYLFIHFQIEHEGRYAVDIANGARELTDVITHENHPEWNREERKRRESDRLGKITPLSQSVKYADLIDNTSSIVQHDRGFAKVYLKEKQEILSKMRKGNPALLKRCEETLENALLKLKEETEASN